MSNRFLPAVLITGCATGVGHATALAFTSAGYPTYASGRNLEELKDLEVAGCHILELDVTNEASRVHAVKTIEAQHGTVGILVNNAGYGQMGPLEQITSEQIQRQFETNVFGVLRLCQLVLPGMRSHHSGTIVNVGSAGGLMTTPFMGAYHMTKYAIESLSDALRREVSNFGIRVVLIEPASIRSNFGKTTLASVDTASIVGPYELVQKKVLEITDRAYKNPRLIKPETVAQIIVYAASAKHPKIRYKVGLEAQIMPRMFHILGDRMTDRIWQNILSSK